MSGKVEFIDNSRAFLVKVAVFADLLPALMAAKIENKMKTGGEVPLLPVSTKYAQRGALRQSIRSNRIAPTKYSVTVGVDSPAAAYAAAQEAGITRGHQIKNYSTPGTGAHFFQHAHDAVVPDMAIYAKQAAQQAGISVSEVL